jgi:hypothetical protein
MQKPISYTRRTLPQESKRVPAPRLGQLLNVPQAVTRPTPPFQGSGPHPVNPVLPSTRISAPQ